MRYSQVFKEIYVSYKKYIRIYLAFSLIFSIFAFGGAGFALASGNYDTVQMVSVLGGDIGAAVAVPFIQSYSASIDTPFVMFLMSICSILLDIIPADTLASVGSFLGFDGMENLSNYSFGLIDTNFFRALFIAWFIVSKLSRSVHVSYTVGLILENLENKIGVVVIFLVSATQLFCNIPLGITVKAASAPPQSAEITTYGFNVALCFTVLLCILVIYIFVRCLFFFIDIILLPVCSFVPFASAFLEACKALIAGGIIVLSITCPIMFYIITAVILIIAIVLFKKAYVAIRYFKNIYVKPFMKKFRGYDSEIPLIAVKTPRKVLRYAGSDNVNMIIPVYLLRRTSEVKNMYRYDRWWFVSAQGKQYICKPCVIKNDCFKVELNNGPGESMFIRKNLRFFEIFNLKEKEEDIVQSFCKVHKKLHFVFSKEYFYRFDEIKKLTGFTDYMEYQEQLKMNLKMSRQEKYMLKRQQKMEAREAKRFARKQKKGRI